MDKNIKLILNMTVTLIQYQSELIMGQVTWIIWIIWITVTWSMGQANNQDDSL